MQRAEPLQLVAHRNRRRAGHMRPVIIKQVDWKGLVPGILQQVDWKGLLPGIKQQVDWKGLHPGIEQQVNWKGLAILFKTNTFSR